MQKLFAVGVALTLACSIACGKSAAEREAEEAAAKAAKAAEAATQAANAAAKQAQGDMAKGMADMAKAMAGLAGTTPDGKPVETLTLDALNAALPQMSGWDMDKPRGERITAPFPISQTEATYKKGDAEIEVKVVDAAMAQALLMPWSFMMATGYQKESSDGYEKAVMVGGNPGFERWDKSSKRGELNVLYNKRFMVTIEGDDLADTKILHEFASKLNPSTLK